MLVPIVILLVMAPTSTKALPIDLLKVAEGASESRDHAVMISLDAHGQSAVEGRQITANQREPVVKRIATHGDSTVVDLRSDKNQPFGVVAALLARLATQGSRMSRSSLPMQNREIDVGLCCGVQVLALPVQVEKSALRVRYRKKCC
jgi:biopolymer transport protein ExbD/biopolymer transport protein TolR